MRTVHSLKKLFSTRWLNLFEGKSQYKDVEVSWTFASRKQCPLDDLKPDAVMIVPIIAGENGEPTKLLVTKEFRIPVNGYEYAFPAGLLEEGQSLEENANRELLEETGYEIEKVLTVSPPRLYSSAGMTDEMVQFMIVSAKKVQEPTPETSEDIECILFTLSELREFLGTNPVMGAKAWPICYAFDLAEKFPDC